MVFRAPVSLDALNALSRGTLIEHLGIVFTGAGEDWVRATMPVEPRTRQPYGLLHGGASVVLAETLGSSAGNLCLDTREQMAVFLLRSKEGPTYAPPSCTIPTFADVPCSDPLAPWINELAARGITGGCGSGNYCPTGTVSRGSMAVFLTATFSLPAPSIF